LSNDQVAWTRFDPLGPALTSFDIVTGPAYNAGRYDGMVWTRRAEAVPRGTPLIDDDDLAFANKKE
jgi:hypothetical protein